MLTIFFLVQSDKIFFVTLKRILRFYTRTCCSPSCSLQAHLATDVLEKEAIELLFVCDYSLSDIVSSLITMRSINDELSNLHRPLTVVTEDDDSSLDVS